MKATFLISLIAAVICMALCDGNAEMKAISLACMAEAKVTDKDVEEFLSSDDKFDAASPNMQCHLKCFMEKLGELKNGVYDVDKAIQNLKDIPDLAERKNIDATVLTSCKNEKGANDCETAYKIAKCVRHSKKAK